MKPSGTPAPACSHSCWEHVDSAESCRLGAADLEYGELLPEKPGAVEQALAAEETRIGFNLERLIKSVDGLAIGIAAMQDRAESVRRESGTLRQTVIGETDDFRTTRIDVEDGPEIMRFERK